MTQAGGSTNVPLPYRGCMAAMFPTLDTTSLDGRRARLPDDLDRPTIVILAFQRWQQSEVDAWMEELEALGCPYPIFEVPAIRRRYRWARSFIDGGMRAGIPDPRVRARTLTVYTDVGPMLAALGVSSTDHVVVTLVEPSGTLRALHRGPYAPRAAAPFLGE
jgi:hypothetical protein